MAVQTTLDHYYPPDSIEAESWLHVQRYTHTHHVTWKHVAYAARYHALSSFLQSLGNSYPFDNTSTSNTPSSSSSTLPPSPTTSNSSLESGSSAGLATITASPTTMSASLPALTPTPSEILYLPPRTLGDLEDVFRRLAMAYMLTHISYLRSGLRGSDFSKMKEIAFGGLKELLGHSNTTTSTSTSSSSSPRSRSTDSTTTATATNNGSHQHHQHRSGSAERASGKGRELLRMVEGRQDWDGTVQADRYRRRGSVGSVGSSTSATSVSGSSGALST